MGRPLRRLPNHHRGYRFRFPGAVPCSTSQGLTPVPSPGSFGNGSAPIAQSLNTFLTLKRIEAMVNRLPGGFVGFQTTLRPAMVPHGAIHQNMGGCSVRPCSDLQDCLHLRTTIYLAHSIEYRTELRERTEMDPKRFVFLSSSSDRASPYRSHHHRPLVFPSSCCMPRNNYHTKRNADEIHRWSISCGTTDNDVVRGSFGLTTVEFKWCSHFCNIDAIVIL